MRSGATNRWIVFTAVAALGGFSASALADDGLVETSPFMPSGAPVANVANTEDGSGVELRGVIITAQGPKFSIYDPTQRLSTWVGLEEKGRPFIVRSYDASRDTVRVEFQGQTVTLGLKSAKVSAAPLENFTPPTRPLNEPVALDPTPADEQRRLEAIAAEVNRRRALRQKALQEQRRIREERRSGNGR